MKPKILNFILIGLLVLGFGLLGAATWYGQKLMAGYAKKLDHAKIDADLSQNELERLRHIANQLEQNKSIVDKTNNITTSDKDGNYQDQIVNDITTYARRYGVRISSIRFAESKDAKTVVRGATPRSVEVALQGTINYDTFMKFLTSLETNLPKMNVTSLNIRPDADNPRVILDPTISLEVYVKA